MSVLTPLVTDIENVPIARELAEISAITESTCILLLSFNFNIKNETIITIEIENSSGKNPKIVAIANAPNPT